MKEDEASSKDTSCAGAAPERGPQLDAIRGFTRLLPMEERKSNAGQGAVTIRLGSIKALCKLDACFIGLKRIPGPGDAPTFGEVRIWFSDIRHRFYCTLATMRSSPLYRPQRFDPSSTTPYEVAKSPLQEAVFFNSLGYVSPTDANTGSPIDADIVLKGVGFTAGAIIPLPSSNSAIVASGVNLRRVSLTDGSLMWENTLKKMGLGVWMQVLAATTLPPDDNGVAPAAAAAAGPSTGTSSSSSTAGAASGFSDVVFVSVRGKIHAVRVSNGETVWRYDHGLMKRIERAAAAAGDPGRIAVFGRRRQAGVYRRHDRRKGLVPRSLFPRRETSETLFLPGLPTLN
ncbi:hypothetical protein DFJ73DRAFT_759561 [Zopfochytrium polystomum]|nr:hypothetical protein DFJ73DRAFT_759561 [Zopfochytrium polystomum]